MRICKPVYHDSGLLKTHICSGSAVRKVVLEFWHILEHANFEYVLRCFEIVANGKIYRKMEKCLKTSFKKSLVIYLL